LYCIYIKLNPDLRIKLGIIDFPAWQLVQKISLFWISTTLRHSQHEFMNVSPIGNSRDYPSRYRHGHIVNDRR
jgi:hypothetical protein